MYIFQRRRVHNYNNKRLEMAITGHSDSPWLMREIIVAVQSSLSILVKILPMLQVGVVAVMSVQALQSLLTTKMS